MGSTLASAAPADTIDRKSDVRLAALRLSLCASAESHNLLIVMPGVTRRAAAPRWRVLQTVVNGIPDTSFRKWE
jgi:hypothetical protein